MNDAIYPYPVSIMSPTNYYDLLKIYLICLVFHLFHQACELFAKAVWNDIQMMQEAEVHILLGIKIILFALGNQISCKKNCSVSSGRTEVFFTKKKIIAIIQFILFVCVCCLDFDTTYPEHKNEYRKSKEVTINELFPLQYNYFEVHIELNCRICAKNGQFTVVFHKIGYKI